MNRATASRMGYHVLVEDYIRKQQIEKDLADRAALSIVRAERVVEVEPLNPSARQHLDRQDYPGSFIDKAEPYSA